MNLLLQRDPTKKGATIGWIYADSEFECFSLEPPIREVEGQPVSAWKVYGSTAIPEGTYEILLRRSPRMGNRFIPHLQNVPGFSEVEIHPGNTVADTKACILVGEVKEEFDILKSKDAFEALLAKIKFAIGNEEKVFIKIVNPNEHRQENCS